jgi:hypothetical protein
MKFILLINSILYVFLKIFFTAQFGCMHDLQFCFIKSNKNSSLKQAVKHTLLLTFQNVHVRHYRLIKKHEAVAQW